MCYLCKYMIQDWLILSQLRDANGRVLFDYNHLRPPGNVYPVYDNVCGMLYYLCSLVNTAQSCCLVAAP